MHKSQRLTLIACVMILPSVALCQEIYAKPSWYISAFGGHSATVLGSRDLRTYEGIGLAWARPEPHFKWRHGPTQLVLEGYFEHSHGHDFGIRGRVTENVGALWYARFRFPTKSFNLYGDLGWGAQLASSESFDLGTRFNSTPMFGLGFAFRQGNHEMLLGVRVIHVSNASLNQDNRGQNQVLVYTSVKF